MKIYVSETLSAAYIKMSNKQTKFFCYLGKEAEILL